MKFKPILLLLILLLVSILAFGCTSSKEQANMGESKDRAAEKESKATATETPTRENPMVVDKKNGVIKLYAEVNAKYFVEPTRHGVIKKGGVYADKTILTAFTSPEDFYNALIELGAKAGNNVQIESPPGTIVEGDVLKVTVTVDGKTYDFWDIIKAEPDQGWEPRFGGNLENSKAKNTGCILCLDSCSVGIASNAKYGYKSFNDGKAKFYARQEILKEDKKPVTVSFELKNKVSRAANGFQYKTASEVKGMIKSKEPMHIVDIQVENEYKSGHIKGSIATYAFPVKTDEEKAKLDAIMSKIKKDEAPIIIVCPRGAGGAERTYNYLKAKGIDEYRLFILKKGWAGWPYSELSATGLN